MMLSRIGQQEIGRDRDISAWPEDGICQDLTVLQDHILRIDIHAAAAAGAVMHRCADHAVGELHCTIGIRRDFDHPTA